MGDAHAPCVKSRLLACVQAVAQGGLCYGVERARHHGLPGNDPQGATCD